MQDKNRRQKQAGYETENPISQKNIKNNSH